MKSHSLKTILGLAVMFLIGGLSVLKGTAGVGSWVDMVLSILLMLEHGINGKTA